MTVFVKTFRISSLMCLSYSYESFINSVVCLNSGVPVNTIRIKDVISSIVFLVALNFLLGFSSMFVTYPAVSADHVGLVQVGSEDGSMMITVLNSCSIQSIPGAIVTIGESHYVTNSLGSTTLLVQPSGSITISISHSGYYSSSLLAASSTYAATYTILLVPLRPCYS